MANDIDLDKFYTHAAYRNTTTTFDTERLDKFYAQAAYRDTTVTFNTIRLDKFYTLALYASVPFVPPAHGGGSGGGGKDDKPGKDKKVERGYSQGRRGAVRSVHARRAHHRFVMPPLVAAPSAGSGTVGVWTGSAWVQKPAKVWTGSAWVQKPAKTWNGSTWV